MLGRVGQVDGTDNGAATSGHEDSKVGELAARGDGRMVVLQAAGRTEEDAAWLEAAFTALRQEEWGEFLTDCGKFDAEIDKGNRPAEVHDGRARA